MGGVLIVAVLLVGPAMGMAGVRYAALAFVVSVGMGGYFIIGQMIGAFRLSEFKAAMRR